MNEALKIQLGRVDDLTHRPGTAPTGESSPAPRRAIEAPQSSPKGPAGAPRGAVAASKAIAEHRTNDPASRKRAVDTHETGRDANSEYARLQKADRMLRNTIAHLQDKLELTRELERSTLSEEIRAYQEETVALNPQLLKTAVRKARSHMDVAIARRITEHQKEIIQNSRLFLPTYYLSQIGRRVPGDADPLWHYLTVGWMVGLDPHPLFSVRFYLSRNPDVLAAGVEPLSHYIQFGSEEGRDPHPLFLGAHYKATADAPVSQNAPLLSQFFHNKGNPHPLFDTDYYAKRADLPDSSPAAGLMHYALIGWRKGFDFSPLFKSSFYLSQFESSRVKEEAYTHYVLVGAPHELSPHPLFDARHYLRTRPGVSSYSTDPLLDYLQSGEAQGATPNRFFDTAYYKFRHLTGRTGESALLHYVTTGHAQDCDPSRDFDSLAYRRLHRLPAETDVSPLEHFMEIGMSTLAPGRPMPMTRSAPAKPVPAKILRRKGVVEAEAANRRESAEVESLPFREFPGKRAFVEGAPNILLVAHIAGEYLFGGERSFMDMLEGLNALPANVYVALPQNAPTYTNAIRAFAHKVFVFKYGWWKRDEATSIPAQKTFEVLIKTHDIAAVHANTIMLREPLDAARACGVPAAVHVRELIQSDAALLDLIGQPAEDIIETVKSNADWIIANSEATGDAFWKPGRSFVIPNTIDTAAMDLTNAGTGTEVRFGLISSNIAKKGLMDVVELARATEKSCPEARFVFIGPETELVRHIRQLQLDGQAPANLVFAGYAKSPREAISQVDVVINFSHFAESFGRTVLEAMAARRPVIAYDWGALPELIEHGKNGYLIPYARPTAASTFVAALCKDRSLIRKLGEHGRTLATSKYSYQHYKAAFKEAYEKILPGYSDVERTAVGTGPVVLPARELGAKADSAMPVRLAYFCWHFPVPSETFVLSELEALVKAGVDVIVFCRQSPHRDFVVPFPIKYERVDSAATLARRLNETSRTIVHAHFVYPTVTDMVWPACEAAQVPFTFIAHAQDIFRYENDKRNRIGEIAASALCRKVFVLSRFHHQYVEERGVPKAKLAINPNAVNVEQFANGKCENREERRFRKIIAVSRFVTKKGLSNLVRAAALIKDLNVSIDIYGYGELEPEYKQLVHDLSLQNVALKGPLSQQGVIAAMREADLFACPSVRAADGDMDGIPTSLVESMAAGLPVLTTSLSGIPDLVTDEVTGLITDPSPEGIADSIRRFYGLPDLQVRRMISAAEAHARSHHDVTRLTRTLMRVWDQRTVDIVIVSWNNLKELSAVVDRIVANTATPYHLIICDNKSQRESVPVYLRDLHGKHPNVTVVLNDRNAMVGPGTNLCLQQGRGEFVIYVCGKEGMALANGWELPFIRAMEADPAVGLVGSIGHSPTYLTGKQYPTGVALFSKFRNQEFAHNNPDREFGHVQGGLFGMRRKMYEEIGGFSDAVPHDYTDVEYSFYAESKGWTLGTIDNVLALFNKSRPTLSQRIEENVKVAHPVALEEIETFEAVVRGELKHCNICNWFGPKFAGRYACAGCGAGPEDRSLFKWLSEGKLMYRRLPALAIGLESEMAKVWDQQFQGPKCTVTQFVSTLREQHRLPNKPASLHLAYLRCASLSKDELKIIAKELKRILRPGATALIQLAASECSSAQWREFKTRVRDCLDPQTFTPPTERVYSGQALTPAWIPMLEFTKLSPAPVDVSRA